MEEKIKNTESTQRGRVVVNADGKPVMVKRASAGATQSNAQPANKTAAEAKTGSDSAKKAEVKLGAQAESRKRATLSGVQKSVKKVAKKNDNKKFYMILGGILVLIVILIAVIIAVSSSRGNGNGEEGGDVPVSVEALTTEEEIAQTKQVMDKYVSIEIEGYQRVEAEDGLNDVVVIRIKNTSDERTNLALDVVALDNEDKVLDKTSLYAEGIEPGQEQVFHAFALSELTPEQLKNAHYEVYRANTYVLDVVPDNNEAAQEEETPQE